MRAVQWKRLKLNYGNRHEWINNDMKAEIKERERLLINSKKYPTEDNIRKYKRFRNQVLSNQWRATRNYYHEQFEIRGPNTKILWALIHFFTRLGNKNTQKNMKAFLINGKLMSDNIVIASYFEMLIHWRARNKLQRSISTGLYDGTKYDIDE